jgi:hypothetical protein
MKRVFLDNNIYINAFERMRAREIDLVANLLSAPDSVLVLSEELLLEFSQSGSKPQAELLLDSALKHTCIWARNFLDIQKQEVGNFILTSLLKKPSEPVSPFSEKFECLDENSHPNIRPRDLLFAMVDEFNREPLKPNLVEYAKGMQLLQEARKAKSFTPQMSAESDQSILRARISSDIATQADAAGHSFDEVLNHCLNSSNFYNECPSINAERHLADHRASDPRRKPILSDLQDLILSVAVFPYVDYFVTGDGYLIEGLKYVKIKNPQIKTQVIRP